MIGGSKPLSSSTGGVYTGAVYHQDVNEDDLSSEWETIKKLPGAKALAEDIDLRRELQGMAPHPEHVYKFIEDQYGLRYMSIWRYKCIGQKIVHGRYPFPTDCWIVMYDAPIWIGERVGVGNPVHTPKDMSRVFQTPKKSSYVTLDEVRAAFIVVRDKAIKNQLYEIRRWRDEITKRQADIADYEADIAKMTDYVPKLEGF